MPDSYSVDPNFEDADEAAKTAVMRRYWQFCVKWAEGNAKIQCFQAEIAQLEAEQQKIAEQLNNCVVAGRLFGLDVVLESQRQLEDRNRQQNGFGVIEAPIEVPSISRVPKPPRIKDLVLQLVERAYPKPVKAVEIRQNLAAQGVTLHEKTVGMTLTRWQAKGRVRCDGWNWFFVPQTEEEEPTGIGMFGDASEDEASSLH